MTTELLTNSIVIDNLSITDDYDVDIHINKRLENFAYGMVAPEAAVGISYIGYDPPTTTTALNFADLSEYLRENAFFFNQGTTNIDIVSGSTYRTRSNSIEGTDIFLTSANASGKERPAWYRHRLPSNTVSARINSIDHNGTTRAVSPFSYTVSLESGNVFTDLKNNFNSTTGEYILYYVDSKDSSDATQRHLLRSDSMFHLGTYEDVDSDTGFFYEDSGAYIINQIGNAYEFTFANSNKKAIRQSPISRLRANMKPDLSLSHSWFPYVTNGSITQYYNGYTYVYEVNEFEGQDFIPYSPYLFTIKESLDVLAPNVLRTRQGRVAHDEYKNIYMDIIVTNDLGTIKHQVSSNPDIYADDDWTYCQFDVDENLGLIYCPLGPAILPGDSVVGTYYYAAETLELSWLDLNPQRHLGIENYMHVIYAVPNVDDNYSSIYYLKVDKNNIIVEANQGVGAHTPLHPTAFIDMRKEDDDGNCNATNTVVGWEYRNYGGSFSGGEFWTETYSVEGENNYQYLILAEITYVPPVAPDLATKLDARVLGGGVRMEDLQSVVEAAPVVQYSFPDLIDTELGTTYPGHFAHYVRYPYTLLEKYGGSYTEEWVMEQIRAHGPTTAYYIIEPHGVIPRICEVSAGSTSGTIDISWAVEAPQYGYNVYVSSSWEGPWYGGTDVNTVVNSYPIVLSSYTVGSCGEAYTVTVKSNQVVKIAVTAVNLNTGQESPHSTIYEVRAAE